MPKPRVPEARKPGKLRVLGHRVRRAFQRTREAVYFRELRRAESRREARSSEARLLESARKGFELTVGKKKLGLLGESFFQFELGRLRLTMQLRREWASNTRRFRQVFTRLLSAQSQGVAFGNLYLHPDLPMLDLRHMLHTALVEGHELLQANPYGPDLELRFLRKSRELVARAVYPADVSELSRRWESVSGNLSRRMAKQALAHEGRTLVFSVKFSPAELEVLQQTLGVWNRLRSFETLGHWVTQAQLDEIMAAGRA